MEILLKHLFEIVITGLATMLVLYFKDMKKDVNNMSTSMIDMNVKLSTVITKHDNTEYVARRNSDEIDDVKARVHKLEGGQSQLLHFLEHDKQ